ncbi:retrovirus-related Pol polyprotein from transposon opus [Trichonephila clavipes]|nr:retrovirus-related Pol polyprotein from transposon opus [Trichonephila clavipes]
MQSLQPKPPKHHGKRPVFIHPGLLEATHVFLRRDMLRRPLQQPYDGPFKVLQRKDKVFSLDINGKRVSVSIDRCKPAFFLNTEDLQLPQTKNETPATVEPNATASTPATVESDPTASTPTQPSTRSGRKVHLPTSEECLTTQRGNGNNWDSHLPYLMFAYREVLHSTTGVSPYQLVHGRLPNGPLKLLKEVWTGGKEIPTGSSKSIEEYLRDLTEKLKQAHNLARGNSEKAQAEYAIDTTLGLEKNVWRLVTKFWYLSHRHLTSF